jgi:hypothetical protein
MASHKLVMKNAQRVIAGKMKDPNAPGEAHCDKVSNAPSAEAIMQSHKLAVSYLR